MTSTLLRRPRRRRVTRWERERRADAVCALGCPFQHCPLVNCPRYGLCPIGASKAPPKEGRAA